jgi:hypothetical protein
MKIQVATLIAVAATMAPTDPFTLTGSRYDQDTFLGRLMAIVDLFNPKQLLRSEAEIEGEWKECAGVQVEHPCKPLSSWCQAVHGMPHYLGHAWPAVATIIWPRKHTPCVPRDAGRWELSCFSSSDVSLQNTATFSSPSFTPQAAGHAGRCVRLAATARLRSSQLQQSALQTGTLL